MNLTTLAVLGHLLFIDLNLSQKEFMAINDQVAVRHENMTMVPQQAIEFWSLDNEKQSIEMVFRNKTDLDSQLLKQQQLKRVNADIEKLKTTYHIERDLYPHVKMAVEKLLKKGERITTLVISGHHSVDGSSYGEVSQLLPFVFNQLVQDFPILAETVTQLILPGCYTATVREIRDFENLFPHVYFIGGYSGQGLRNSDALGIAYVKRMSQLSPRLKDARSWEDLKKLSQELGSGFASLEMAFYLRVPESQIKGYYDYKFAKESLMPWDPNDCSLMLRGLNANKDLFEIYDIGSAIIPEQTSGTPLRKLYTDYQQAEHCLAKEIGTDKAHSYTQKAFFLVFFHPVYKNFRQAHQQDLNQILNQIQFCKDESLRTRLIDRLSRYFEADLQRSTVLTVQRDLKQMYSEMFETSSEANSVTYSEEATQKLKDLLQQWIQNTESQLVDFSQTPVSWHEWQQE